MNRRLTLGLVTALVLTLCTVAMAADIGDSSAEEATDYTASFDTDGGESIDSITDWTITLPLPVYDGHVCTGWYIDGVLAGNPGSDVELTEDVTFTAGWTTDTEVYTVEFYSGETLERTQYVISGGTATEPIIHYSGSGIDGWYTDSDLTASYDFSTVITGDTVLYASVYDEGPVLPEMENIIDSIGIVPIIMAAIGLVLCPVAYHYKNYYVGLLAVALMIIALAGALCFDGFQAWWGRLTE